MPNFLQEMKMRFQQRTQITNLPDSRSQESLDLRRKNVQFNESVFTEATRAFVDTGIDMALEEIARELREQNAVGVRVFIQSTDINDETSTAYNNYGNKRYKEGSVRVKQIVREVGWDTKGEKTAGEFAYEGHNFFVLFHADGRLEFVSGVGTIVNKKPSASSRTGNKSRFLSKKQWSTNSNLVSRYLEEAYRNPSVTVQRFKYQTP